jgi:hypothetical protein
MTIQVPADVANAVEEVSKASGADPQQLLLDALKAHFPPLPPELKAELDAWNLASDEDAVMIDKLLDAH